ncbi:MAG: hypothetical protein U0746_22010 [Gemmataceae bacterium]
MNSPWRRGYVQKGARWMFRVHVNWAEVHPVASSDKPERLCTLLAGLPAFTAHATGAAGENGPTLDVIITAGRGVASFCDTDRGIKLVSRNPACSDRDIVSLANDAYPDLQLDQIEVERRDLISPSWAVALLRHFLVTGEPIDLVPWPPDDWDDRPITPEPRASSGEEIPF